MGDVLYIIYCFIGFLCSVIPSIWHWKYRNVAPLCLIFWVSATNLIYFLNAIIWFDGHRTKYLGYVYCDIATKFILVSITGELGAITAISHYLSKIMKPTHSSTQTKVARKNQAIKDILLSFAAPITIMCLHYIVQPARYVINGISGCVPWVDRSWLSIIIFIWPPLFGILAAYYSGKVIILYFKKQKEFQSVLKDSKSSITLSRFIRLIGISSVMVMVYLPLNIYLLSKNISEILASKIAYSWSSVHQWNTDVIIVSNDSISFNLWLSPSNGIAIFIFFGMGSDALAMYKEIAKKLYITSCFNFIKRLFFGKKMKDIKDAEDYYNSYDFEKSLDSCPPLFYSQTRDVKIYENGSLNDYSYFPPIYMDYNNKQDDFSNLSVHDQYCEKENSNTNDEHKQDLQNEKL